VVVESAPVGHLIGAVLEKAGYRVVLADTPAAKDALRDAPADLLITNEPWSFEPFAAGLRVLYISGAADKEFLQRYPAHQVAFLQKPFRFQNLLLSVHLLLTDPAKSA